MNPQQLAARHPQSPAWPRSVDIGSVPRLLVRNMFELPTAAIQRRDYASDQYGSSRGATSTTESSPTAKCVSTKDSDTCEKPASDTYAVPVALGVA